MSTVLYPGSFDPFHLGHLDVVEQAVALFGDVVVAVMHNPDKPSGLLSTDERIALVKSSCDHLPSVRVQGFVGLAVDAAQTINALCIVKGLRTPADFEVEQQMAHTNFAVAKVRTVYVPSNPALSYVSSRYIRDIAMFGGNISSMVPSVVGDHLRALFSSRSK